MSSSFSSRLTQLIARSGLCSRREADRLVLAGRVSIDGTPTIKNDLVTLDQRVLVDGIPLSSPLPPRLFIYNKPPAQLVSHQSHSIHDKGRHTVFSYLNERYPQYASFLPSLNFVGRLDVNSEGLLLLTNDGGIKRFLERPLNAMQRRYRVRAFGPASKKKKIQDRTKRPVQIDGITYDCMQIIWDSDPASPYHHRHMRSADAAADALNHWCSVILTEGKNREIRKVFEHFSMRVNRLIRETYGPYTLSTPSITDSKQHERETHKSIGVNSKMFLPQWKGLTEASYEQMKEIYTRVEKGEMREVFWYGPLDRLMKQQQEQEKSLRLQTREQHRDEAASLASASLASASVSASASASPGEDNNEGHPQTQVKASSTH